MVASRKIYEKLILKENGLYLLEDGVDPEWITKKLLAGKVLSSTFMDQSR
jgi:hypothetical protein